MELYQDEDDAYTRNNSPLDRAFHFLSSIAFLPDTISAA
jgi:hypothetical protein